MSKVLAPDDNPWYPLPDNYDILPPDMQREARLGVIMDQSTPDKLVRAWELFRSLYLKPTPAPGAPLFYKGKWVESPDFHYQMVHDLGAYGRNVSAAPRGSGKSIVLGTELPLLLSLTRPNIRMVLGLSTVALVQKRFDILMQHLTRNPLILEDFGTMKPKKGEAMWNHSHLALLNGSVIEGFAVMGRKRGARPDIFILDDPEYDPESESEESALMILEKFHTFLFKQVIPMLEAGSAIFWIGTMIQRRSAIWNACMEDDPRFSVWNRRIYKAISYDPENPTTPSLLWPAKWPKAILDARREEIGDAAFSSEYCNTPISESARTFRIDPQLNEYTIPGLDVKLFTSLSGRTPIGFQEEVIWMDKEKTGELVEKRASMHDLFGPMFRLLCVDYSHGLTSRHDYKCVGVFGFDAMNTLWILDMWAKRTTDEEMMAMVFLMGLKWRVRIVGIEACGAQMALIDSVDTYMENHSNEAPDWAPRVLPVKYPVNTKKGRRILSALQWRYPHGRIKYPAHMKGYPPIDMAYTQTDDFTPDLAMLPHDDVIDTIAMANYAVHSRGSKPIDEPEPMTVSKRIQTQSPVLPGLPLLSGVNANELTLEDVDNLVANTAVRRYNRRYRNRPRRR